MRTHLWAVICLAISTVVIPSLARSQDEKKQAEPAATTDKPATEKPAEDKPEPPVAEAKGPAATKFAATYDQWKEVLKKLRTLRTKYQTAEEEEAAALRLQWNDTIAAADKLLPQLRTDAIAAYDESPNLDSTITRFLKKLLDDDVAQDRFEDGAKLAQTLIAGGAGFKDIYNQAGLCAFVLNDYDKAEEYFKVAADAKVLDKKTTEYQEIIPDYKKFWQAEQEIRAKEATANDLPRVKLTTTKGDIVIELFENEAPQTVGNFVNLVEKKFYDGTVFHRVLPNFMAQGGDPTGSGKGGPGYQIPCECYKPEARKHFRGTLSMAHAGKDTGGSQFFLTFVPTAHLNGAHTAFGRVIEGMDVLAKLQRIDPMDPSTAAEPDKITKAEVIRKRDHEYVPTKVE